MNTINFTELTPEQLFQNHDIIDLFKNCKDEEFESLFESFVDAVGEEDDDYFYDSDISDCCIQLPSSELTLYILKYLFLFNSEEKIKIMVKHIPLGDGLGFFEELLNRHDYKTMEIFVMNFHPMVADGFNYAVSRHKDYFAAQLLAKSGNFISLPHILMHFDDTLMYDIIRFNICHCRIEESKEFAKKYYSDPRMNLLIKYFIECNYIEKPAPKLKKINKFTDIDFIW